MASKAGSDSMKVRLIVQQCISASLKLPPEYTSTSTVGIDTGMVAFVAFLKGADEATAKKAAESVCSVELCEAEEESECDKPQQRTNRRVSVLTSGRDILIIPQHALSGKLKGKRFQYHSGAPKELSERLYELFVSEVRQQLPDTAKVAAGVYGARQVLSMDTFGPYTHIVEL